MREINTVTGVRNISELGTIDPHEHIFIDIRNQYAGKKTVYKIDGDHDKVSIENIGSLRRNCYLLKDNLILDNFETALEELKYFKASGGDTIIEQTPCGMGREICKLKDLSLQTGIKIIVSTGFMTFDVIPAKYAQMETQELAKHFVSEIQKGIAGTGIKAGVIGEIGTSDSIYPVEEKMLRAAAMAQLETGAKVFVHTYPWGMQSHRILDILSEYDLDMENVCLCHLDVLLNMDHIQSVLDRGVYIEFDDFGKEYYIIKEPKMFAGGAFAMDIERVRTIQELCAKGFQSKLLLANDIPLKSMLHRYGGWGYDHILQNILPMMVSEGFDQALIDELIRINPQRFLTGRM